MAGFYGNIRNATSNSFKFDRIYSNKALMNKHKDDDGVFGGRYVLVEYDQGLTEGIDNSSVSATYYKVDDKYFTKEPIIKKTVEVIYIEDIIDSFYIETEDTSRVGDKKYYYKVNSRYEEYTNTAFPESTHIYERYNNGKTYYKLNESEEYVLVSEEIDLDTIDQAHTGLYEKFEVNEYELAKGDEAEEGVDEYEHEEFDLIEVRERRLWIDEDNNDYILIEEGDLSGYYLYRNKYYDKKYKLDQDNNPMYEKTSYILLYTEDNDEPYVIDADSDREDNYQINYGIDKAVYGTVGRGYDSTVWRKVYQQGKAKYVNIAELNSVVPTFALTADAPTDAPWNPHFGKDSTNVYYNLHMQVPWGFAISDSRDLNINGLNGKTDVNNITLEVRTVDAQHNTKWVETKTYPGAIYFNKAGFERDAYSTYSGIKTNEIQIREFKSGKKYASYDDDSNFEMEECEDMKGLSIILPAIGDAISEMWDIIYGPSDYIKVQEGSFRSGGTYYRKERSAKDPFDKYVKCEKVTTYSDDLYEPKTKDAIRKTALSWEDANIKYTSDFDKRHLVHYDRADSRSDYYPAEGSSLVGTINSAHDIMGMIITKEPPFSTVVDGESCYDPHKTLTDKIYYINNSKKALDENGEPGELLRLKHYYYVSKTPGFEEISSNEINEYLQNPTMQKMQDFKEKYGSNADKYENVLKGKTDDRVKKLPAGKYAKDGNVYRVTSDEGIARDGVEYYNLPRYLEYVGHPDGISTDDGVYYYKKVANPAELSNESSFNAIAPYLRPQAGVQSYEEYTQDPANLVTLISKYECYPGEDVLEQWASDPNGWYTLPNNSQDAIEASGFILTGNWLVRKANYDNPLKEENYKKVSSIICADNDRLIDKYKNGDIKNPDDLIYEIVHSQDANNLDLPNGVPQLFYVNTAWGDDDNPNRKSYEFVGVSAGQFLYPRYCPISGGEAYETEDEDIKYCYKNDRTKDYYETEWPLFAIIGENKDPFIVDETVRFDQYTYYIFPERKLNLLTSNCYYAIFEHEDRNPLDAKALEFENNDEESDLSVDLNEIIPGDNRIITFNRVVPAEIDANLVSDLHSYWKVVDSNGIESSWGSAETAGLVGFGVSTDMETNAPYISTNIDAYYTDSSFYFQVDGTNTYLPANAFYGFDINGETSPCLPCKLFIPRNQYYITHVDDDYKDSFDLYQKFNTEIIQKPEDIAYYFGGQDPILKIGVEKPSKKFKELPGFDKDINTLHGLLLRINEVLQTGNLKTHDMNTVQGCLNVLQDTIAKFDPLIPGDLYGVNMFGRLGSVGLNGSDGYILTEDASAVAGKTYYERVVDPVTNEVTYVVYQIDNEHPWKTGLYEPESWIKIGTHFIDDENDLDYGKTILDVIHKTNAFADDKLHNGASNHEVFGYTSQTSLEINSPVIDNAGHVNGQRQTEVMLSDLLLKTNEEVNNVPTTVIATLNSPDQNYDGTITTSDDLKDAIRTLVNHINEGANNITLNDYYNYYGDSTANPPISPAPSMGDDVDNDDNINEAIAKLQWQLNHIANRPLTDLDAQQNALPSGYSPFGNGGAISANDSLGLGLNKLQAQISNLNTRLNTTNTDILNNYCGIIRRAVSDGVPSENSGIVDGTTSNGETRYANLKSGWIWVDTDNGNIYIKTQDGLDTELTGSGTQWLIDRNYWELLNAWQ